MESWIDSERVFLLWCVSCVGIVNTDLGKEVTDSGLSALAWTGCGAQLTSLTLWGEGFCLPLFLWVVYRWIDIVGEDIQSNVSWLWMDVVEQG